MKIWGPPILKVTRLQQKVNQEQGASECMDTAGTQLWPQGGWDTTVTSRRLGHNCDVKEAGTQLWCQGGWDTTVMSRRLGQVDMAWIYPDSWLYHLWLLKECLRKGMCMVKCLKPLSPHQLSKNSDICSLCNRMRIMGLLKHFENDHFKQFYSVTV